MHSNDFEKSYSDFMERRECDEAYVALFSIMRISFTAGWLAAGGTPPEPPKVFELFAGCEVKEIGDKVKE